MSSLKNIHFKNLQGQTLVAIVFLMVLALGIGITVSDTFISSVHNLVSTDNGVKARSVAESALERILLLPVETLDTYIQLGTCGSDCSLTLPDGSSAVITLSYDGLTSDPYEVPLNANVASEVSLDGYGSNIELYVCWNGDSSIYASYIFNNSSGVVTSDAYAYNSVGGSHLDTGFNTATAGHGFQNCFTVVTRHTPLALRLRSLFNSTTVYVIPYPGQSIPRQGIHIVSTGTFKDATKKVSVTIADPIVPDVFDYALYQTSDTDTLSN